MVGGWGGWEYRETYHRDRTTGLKVADDEFGEDVEAELNSGESLNDADGTRGD
jgi:hypothetical protein